MWIEIEDGREILNLEAMGSIFKACDPAPPRIVYCYANCDYEETEVFMTEEERDTRFAELKKMLLVKKPDIASTVSAIGAVPDAAVYIHLLEKRLKHLLESDYIRQFDERDPHTHQYKRDIRDAIGVQLVRHGKWKLTHDSYVYCSICQREANSRWYEYCLHCGAKMDGGHSDET